MEADGDGLAASPQLQPLYSCRYDSKVPLTKRHPRPPASGSCASPRPARRRPSSPSHGGALTGPVRQVERDASPYVLRPVVSTMDAATGRNLLHSGVDYDTLISLVAWSGAGHNPVLVARSMVANVLASAATASAADQAQAADVAQDATIATVGEAQDEAVPGVSVSPLSPQLEQAGSQQHLDEEAVPVGWRDHQKRSSDSFQQRSYSHSTCTWPDHATGSTVTLLERTASPVLPGEAGPVTNSTTLPRKGSWPSQPNQDSSVDVASSSDRDHVSDATSTATTSLMRHEPSLSPLIPERRHPTDLVQDTVDVALSEHRVRGRMEAIEEQAWLTNVVYPWASIPDDDACIGAVSSSVADEEAARHKGLWFRYRMTAHAIQRLVATESVARSNGVAHDASAALEVLHQAFRKRARELRGLAPLRRVLLRYALKRRRSNNALALRQQRLGHEETTCRTAIAHAAGIALLQRGSGFVGFEEAFYREQLYHLYANVVANTLFAWVWLRQRCALFPICFSYTLAQAPRMSGRVCGQSLFHLLSERESLARAAIACAFDACLDAMQAHTVAAALASGEEPDARQILIDEERAKRRMLFSTRARVTAMVQRRDVEFAEMDGRSVVVAEWCASWPKHEPSSTRDVVAQLPNV